VIDVGVEGLSVPPGDSAAIATGLRRLIKSPGKRNAMAAAAGRDRAKATFGINDVMHRTSAIYRELRPGKGGN
jgi:glycosyltransferase involved in cell wall biosynthesis